MKDFCERMVNFIWNFLEALFFFSEYSAGGFLHVCCFIFPNKDFCKNYFKAEWLVNWQHVHHMLRFALNNIDCSLFSVLKIRLDLKRCRKTYTLYLIEEFFHASKWLNVPKWDVFRFWNIFHPVSSEGNCKICRLCCQQGLFLCVLYGSVKECRSL